MGWRRAAPRGGCRSVSRVREAAGRVSGRLIASGVDRGASSAQPGATALARVAPPSGRRALQRGFSSASARDGAAGRGRCAAPGPQRERVAGRDSWVTAESSGVRRNRVPRSGPAWGAGAGSPLSYWRTGRSWVNFLTSLGLRES